MNTEIIALIAKSGVWAVLFVGLLYYVLRDARARENKYQSIIDSLSTKLDIVEVIQSDVADIKTTCKRNAGVLKEKL